MQDWVAISLYLFPLLLIVVIYSWRHRKQHQISLSVKTETISSGLTEPASLHPLIDPQKCIGCGACVSACPENEVLGLINHKAELIAPSHCIGHGACNVACPEGAITLVFGTEKRGVDIPELNAEFETSVKGIYIAGELGGMGLIRNAIEQSKQAMTAIKKNCLKGSVTQAEVLDTVIIGAGPAGISASLYAIEHNISYQTIEQDSLGGTVAHFPRSKVVMTAPVSLPMVGKVKFTETSKEALLEFWQSIEKKHQLNINYHERMDAIEKQDDIFCVKTTKGTYLTRSVLLTIGRRGTPRKIGVPGEEQSKVSYRLIDPQQYRGQCVLVVGGGDSALEAALSIADVEGTQVTLSYRGEAFNRAKPKNRNRVEVAHAAGKLEALLQSNVMQIDACQVQIAIGDKLRTFDNDRVIACAGGVLPTGLLKSIGIEVTTKHGTE